MCAGKTDGRPEEKQTSARADYTRRNRTRHARRFRSCQLRNAHQHLPPTTEFVDCRHPPPTLPIFPRDEREFLSDPQSIPHHHLVVCCSPLSCCRQDTCVCRVPSASWVPAGRYTNGLPGLRVTLPVDKLRDPHQTHPMNRSDRFSLAKHSTGSKTGTHVSLTR